MVSHKITYTIYEGNIVPGHDPLLPIIETCSDSMCYGDVEFPIPRTDEINYLLCEIYKCDKPEGVETRWIRTGSDLYTSSVINYEGLLITSTRYKITYKFLPSVILAADGEFYSIEFFLSLVNDINSILSPKLIVSIKDRLVT